MFVIANKEYICLDATISTGSSFITLDSIESLVTPYGIVLDTKATELVRLLSLSEEQLGDLHSINRSLNFNDQIVSFNQRRSLIALWSGELAIVYLSDGEDVSRFDLTYQRLFKRFVVYTHDTDLAQITTVINSLDGAGESIENSLKAIDELSVDRIKDPLTVDWDTVRSLKPLKASYLPKSFYYKDTN